MSVQKAYNQWSATYDKDENLTRDLDQVVTRATLGDWRFKSILEIGCGTGKNTALLAQIGEQVHALDFSEGMLEKAREKLGSNKVTFSFADIIKAWPCADESADLVVCNLVLEHIEDLLFIFSEAFRALVKGGRFFICELHPFLQYLGAKARFQSDGEETQIRAFVHHISDFLKAGEVNGFTLQELREWWHEEDQNDPPRLVSFMFEK
jgi:malonyl-CoA O-methyltransferase